MAMEQQKKIEYLTTADKFFHHGDFLAMRACAREILSHDLDDLDGLALLAQASLYLGEEDSLDTIITRIAAADPSNLRMLLVAGERAAKAFDLHDEVTLLRRVWSIGEEMTGTVPPFVTSILERAGRLLVDAYYLLARPREASEMCFALSGLVRDTSEKASLYGMGLFLSNYLPPDKKFLARREGYNAFFGAKVTMPHTPPENGQLPNRKIRVGYISPDFREHAVASFLSPFLSAYSKKDFNVYCYQAGRTDQITKRFKRHAVYWRDVSQMTPLEAARQIFKDGIDILVDFSGHSQGSCLPILSQRPAPVQMTAIGDIYTTGLHEVDYFLSDMTCLPSTRPVHGFTEKVALLPYCHLCYAPDIVKTFPSAANEPAAKRNGYVTFGSFNNFNKVGHETLMLWRAVLEMVPSSRLIVKGKIASTTDGCDEANERFRRIGIDPARVELRPYSPDYLEQYADIDIALDTTPYCGGLTTCEALMMGVPVVTLRGTTHASSYGATILEAAGLPELIAHTEMEYARKAARIAGSMEILEKFHSGLRDVLLHSRLMNPALYMHDVEELYKKLLSDFCSGK
ncbi:MAG: hypothetical protein ACI4OA_00020 [Selenomonadaceae bacterium]